MKRLGMGVLKGSASLGMLRGAGGGMTYLMRDDFISDVAAGAMNATLAEPGPGKRAVSQGALSTHTISGGKLVTTTGPANDDVKWTLADGSALTRAAGILIRHQVTFTSLAAGLIRIMFMGGGTYRSGFLMNGGNLYPSSGTAGAFLLAPAANQPYEFDILIDSVGSKLFWHDGVKNTLVLVEEEYNDATLNPWIRNSSHTITSEYLMVRNIGTALTDLLALSQANPANDTSYSAASAHDKLPGAFLAYFALTAPTPLSGSGELKFWYVDANNYWSIRLDAAGALKLKSVISGTATDNLINSASAAAAGETITCALNVTANRIYLATRKGTTWASKGAYVQLDMLGAGKTTFQVSAADYTATSLRVWPIRSSLIDFGPPRPNGTILTIGDSKTNAGKYQTALLAALATATGKTWNEWPLKIAVNGYTVANMAAIIAAQVSYRGDAPDAVLINLGSNNIAANQGTEADFKTNYRAIIAACHTAYPSAPIYLALPVVLNGNPPSTLRTDTATVRGWINDLIAEQVYIHAGPDETGLEGGDGYATYLADTTHPNDAGYALVGGTLWLAAMGW